MMMLISTNILSKFFALHGNLPCHLSFHCTVYSILLHLRNDKHTDWELLKAQETRKYGDDDDDLLSPLRAAVVVMFIPTHTFTPLPVHAVNSVSQ